MVSEGPGYCRVGGGASRVGAVANKWERTP
jgi:hypothetical protein